MLINWLIDLFIMYTIYIYIHIYIHIYWFVLIYWFKCICTCFVHICPCIGSIPTVHGISHHSQPLPSTLQETETRAALDAIYMPWPQRKSPFWFVLNPHVGSLHTSWKKHQDHQDSQRYGSLQIICASGNGSRPMSLRSKSSTIALMLPGPCFPRSLVWLDWDKFDNAPIIYSALTL